MNVLELIRKIYSSDMKDLIERINNSDKMIEAIASKEFRNQNLLKAQFTRTYYNGSYERRCYFLYSFFRFNDYGHYLSFYWDSIMINKLSKGVIKNSTTLVKLEVDDIFDDDLSLLLRYGRILFEDLKI